MKPIDIVWRVAESDGAWYVVAQGVPGGDHAYGPYRDEQEARSFQLDCARALAKRLGIELRVGNPNRGST